MADDGTSEGSGKSTGTGSRPGGRGMLGELVKAEAMIQLALVLPAACVIGALAGMALDKHFHTGWMVVVGILVGAAAGFVQIFRMSSKYMKRG